MKLSEMYPSRWMSTSDVASGPRLLKISGIELQTMNDGQTKPVLHFVNGGKPLILNQVNARTLEALYGEDSDDWLNQPIVAYQDTTQFQGKSTACIRLRAPKASSQKKEKPAPPADPLAELDDEIPF
jgi:hypothetical protein